MSVFIFKLDESRKHGKKVILRRDDPLVRARGILQVRDASTQERVVIRRVVVIVDIVEEFDGWIDYLFQLVIRSGNSN